MGATHVVSVSCCRCPNESVDPQNMLSVVTRCFQIMTARTESQWRRHSNLVITPDVKDVGWNSFESAEHLIAAGERAASAVLPKIQSWLSEPEQTLPPSFLGDRVWLGVTLPVAIKIDLAQIPGGIPLQPHR